jgi:hypothetical protein
LSYVGYKALCFRLRQKFGIRFDFAVTNFCVYVAVKIFVFGYKLCTVVRYFVTGNGSSSLTVFCAVGAVKFLQGCPVRRILRLTYFHRSLLNPKTGETKWSSSRLHLRVSSFVNSESHNGTSRVCGEFPTDETSQQKELHEVEGSGLVSSVENFKRARLFHLHSCCVYAIYACIRTKLHRAV